MGTQGSKLLAGLQVLPSRLGWAAMHLWKDHEQAGLYQARQVGNKIRCHNFVFISLHFTDQKGPLRMDGWMDG